MYKWYFFISILSLNLLFTGCGDNPYKEEVKELDSIKLEVMTANKIFKTLDSTSLKDISHKVFDDLRFIQRSYKPDTIDMQYSMLINSYKDLRKRCGKYMMIQSRMKKN